MIQRIQSIYLLLASALMVVTMLFPLTYVSIANGDLLDLYISGAKSATGGDVDGSIYMYALAVLSAALPFITIFFFKNRMLQVRLCGFSFVAILGNYAMIGAYFFLVNKAFTEVGVVARGFHPALFAPLAALILVFLAGKAILADELTVRAVDRIR